jgi:hypothetical protein
MKHIEIKLTLSQKRKLSPIRKKIKELYEDVPYEEKGMSFFIGQPLIRGKDFTMSTLSIGIIPSEQGHQIIKIVKDTCIELTPERVTEPKKKQTMDS